MFKNIFALILMFLYLYTISFDFLPYSTTVIFGIFGLGWFSLRFILNKIPIKINKFLITFLFLLSSIGIISIISLAINSTNDIKFISYVFSMIAILFSSYFVVKVLKYIKYETNFKTLVNLIINVIFLQSIIALSMFLIPELKEFLLGLEQLTMQQYSRISSVSEFRIYGLGASKTMYAGIYNGYGLILIAILFRLYKFSSKRLFFISFKFMLIFLVGMMMARTTLVGALLAITIILMPRDLKATLTLVKKRFTFFALVVLIPVSVIGVLFLLSPTFKMIAGPALEYGFEMFVNLFNRGSFETASTNELKTLYVFPTELKTWIIGDGYFSHPTEIGKYYMHTDVGYLRLIYYFGLIGLLSYLTMHIYLIIKAYKNYGVSSHVYMFIIIYFLVLNMKGLTDLLFMHIIFIMAYMMNKNKKTEQYK